MNSKYIMFFLCASSAMFAGAMDNENPNQTTPQFPQQALVPMNQNLARLHMDQQNQNRMMNPINQMGNQPNPNFAMNQMGNLPNANQMVMNQANANFAMNQMMNMPIAFQPINQMDNNMRMISQYTYTSNQNQMLFQVNDLLTISQNLFQNQFEPTNGCLVFERIRVFQCPSSVNNNNNFNNANNNNNVNNLNNINNLNNVNNNVNNINNLNNNNQVNLQISNMQNIQNIARSTVQPRLRINQTNQVDNKLKTKKHPTTAKKSVKKITKRSNEEKEPKVTQQPRSYSLTFDQQSFNQANMGGMRPGFPPHIANRMPITQPRPIENHTQTGNAIMGIPSLSSTFEVHTSDRAQRDGAMLRLPEQNTSTENQPDIFEIHSAAQSPLQKASEEKMAEEVTHNATEVIEINDTQDVEENQEMQVEQQPANNPVNQLDPNMVTNAHSITPRDLLNLPNLQDLNLYTMEDIEIWSHCNIKYRAHKMFDNIDDLKEDKRRFFGGFEAKYEINQWTPNTITSINHQEAYDSTIEDLTHNDQAYMAWSSHHELQHVYVRIPLTQGQADELRRVLCQSLFGGDEKYLDRIVFTNIIPGQQGGC